MANPETGELYPITVTVLGYKASCTKCKRGYASTDGKRFFSKANAKIIEAIYDDEVKEAERLGARALERSLGLNK